jgi:hypothetical protein
MWRCRMCLRFRILLHGTSTEANEEERALKVHMEAVIDAERTIAHRWHLLSQLHGVSPMGFAIAPGQHSAVRRRDPAREPPAADSGSPVHGPHR